VCFVGIIWLIWLIDLAFDLELQKFGVFPRELHGLVGIVVGPLIHGSFEHVFSNTLPLLVLGSAFLYAYPKSALIGMPAIYVGSGVGVWLFARSSYHIGASGLNYGMMFFLFMIGILRRDRLSIAISLTVFFLYGSMVWGIFPTKVQVSFESHLFGAIIGTGFAILFRRYDPALPEKRYDWEDEPNDTEDSVIEDPRRSVENAKKQVQRFFD
jgi:membrane associated rhomboid family serine protease